MLRSDILRPAQSGLAAVSAQQSRRAHHGGRQHDQVTQTLPAPQRVVKNPFIDVLAEALQERDGVLYQTTAYDLLGIRPQQRTAKTAMTLKKALEDLGYRESSRREHGANVTAYAKGGPGERRRFEVDESLVGRVGLRYREG
jgi:hypothetical protein